MFDNFTSKQIKVQETTINLVQGGSGYPVLLLHGYPQTHVCWHLIAPMLAKHFTVICTDLRGCGDSAKPPGDEKHLAYSKRIMAKDQVEVMEELGFSEFAVVAHDRGARVAHRMALDYSGKVTKLVLLDIVPTSWAFSNVDKEIATAAFNWFFSIQSGGLPERLINAERAFYIQWLLDDFAGKKNILAEKAVAEYKRCFDSPSVHATCEEFRASATIDLEHDEVDKSKKISCPVFILWSATGMWAKYDILNLWKSRADNVKGKALHCGHFLQEEDPIAVAEELIAFLS